ncbi:MAG: NADH-quinone oxidoreductase subunit A [Thermoguttaceae bacterium]|jgi:NADH-quinone oxidoreductase subunit A
MATGRALPVFLLVAAVVALAMVLLALAGMLNPARPGVVKRMPYESGMDPVHDTRRRFDVRFHLLAIAFLVFDVELLFLYPWAVAMHRTEKPAAAEPIASAAEAGSAAAETLAAGDPPAAVAAGLAGSRDLVFAGAMLFIALLGLGFVYDWRKGVFLWR